uniref:Annexin n=1 Tax=Mesocestoides corti TaxID=53468 RepID=A0A5K3FGX8_MESCO
MAVVFDGPNFNPQEDADALEKAMRGLGTDEDAIINILAYRTVSGRQQIARQYKASYGQDLQKRLKQELSGRFKDVVLKSFLDKAHLRARALYEAMKGAGTKESIIIQTICLMNNEEIAALRCAYEDSTLKLGDISLRRDLEKDVRSDLSGDFELFIVALLQGMREEGLDPQAAEADAEALASAGEKKLGTDEAVFTKIFARRSYEMIRLLDKLYYEVTTLPTRDLLARIPSVEWLMYGNHSIITK